MSTVNSDTLYLSLKDGNFDICESFVRSQFKGEENPDVVIMSKGREVGIYKDKIAINVGEYIEELENFRLFCW